MTFEETMKGLEDGLNWYLRKVPQKRVARLAAMFKATSAEAAEELASWWRGRTGVEVSVVEHPPTTRGDVEQLAARAGWDVERMLDLGEKEQRFWVVEVIGSANLGADLEIKVWVNQLREMPQDPRWAYTGGAMGYM
jgi:hypothetical protein